MTGEHRSLQPGSAPRRRRLRTLRGALCVLSACVAVGCSGSDGRPESAPIFPVDGRLFVGRRPATGALVSFHPSDGGPIVVAQVLEDGRFFPKRPDGAIGLPEGAYVLTATWPDDGSDRFGGKHSDSSKPIARLNVKAGVNLIPPIRLP